MNEQDTLNLDRARTILSRVAAKYPDLLVVRMLNNALLFASAKLNTPLAFELDSSGGCRCYEMEEAFEKLEEAAEFTRDDKTGVMRVTQALTDPGEAFAAQAAEGFPYMLDALGKRPEIPGDDEAIRMFNELMAMTLSLGNRQENAPASKEAIMEEYDVFHSGPRVERAGVMCGRMLDALRRWKP